MTYVWATVNDFKQKWTWINKIFLRKTLEKIKLKKLFEIESNIKKKSSSLNSRRALDLELDPWKLEYCRENKITSQRFCKKTLVMWLCVFYALFRLQRKEMRKLKEKHSQMVTNQNSRSSNPLALLNLLCVAIASSCVYTGEKRHFQNCYYLYTCRQGVILVTTSESHLYSNVSRLSSLSRLFSRASHVTCVHTPQGPWIGLELWNLENDFLYRELLKWRTRDLYPLWIEYWKKILLLNFQEKIH